MKKRKIAKAALAVLSIMTIGASGAALAACDGCNDDHEHSYGKWTITLDPTLTSGGKAERNCEVDDYTDKKDIPALSDTTVWTEKTDSAVDATHTTAGQKVYTSEYGEVILVIPADSDAHTYGGWTITKDPTLSAPGKAKHTCTDTDKHEEEVDIPALSNTEVWTVDAQKSEDATHTKAGKTVYSSVYGEVEVVIPANADAHTYGDWTITQDPTLSAPGKAKHTCTDTDKHEEEVDIPALSNTEVWTIDAQKGVAATHTTPGKAVYKSEYGEVEVVIPADANAHTFGVWSFVDGERPTWTDGGRIKHTCTSPDAHTEPYTAYENVPALSDTTFWKRTEVTTPPTHQTGGVANFRNEAYKLSVFGAAIPKAEHTFGNWVITTDPTTSTEGEATRVCTESDCASDATATEKFTLPALSDTEFWTAGTPVAPDYNHAGSITYTNATYGSVTAVGAPKLAAPYDNKTYASIELSVNDGNSLKVNYNDRTSYTLTVGNDGVGYGDASPFRGKFVFELLNAETGYLKITQYDIKTSSSGGNTGDGDDWGDMEGYALRAATEYEEEPNGVIYGYVDMTTGVLVFQSGQSWNRVYVAAPTDAAVQSDFKAATCLGDFIISYTDDDTVTNILVTDGGVVFGVDFVQLGGYEADVLTCFNIEENETGTVFVYDEEGKLVKGYSFSELKEEWVEADGLQGVYTIVGTEKEVTINGADYIHIDGVGDRNYKVVSNTADSKVVGVIIDNVYYEYTLSGDGMSEDGGACTEATPKVTITLDFNGYIPDGQDKMTLSDEVSKFVPQEIFTDLEHETMQFRGWYLDAACSDGKEAKFVDGAFTPEGDVTLYAKWLQKVVITLEGVMDGDPTEIRLGVGEIYGDFVPEYIQGVTVDRAKGKMFAGWTIGGEGVDLSDATVAEGDDGVTIVATWENCSSVYGTFIAMNISASSGTFSEATSYKMTVTIDKDGVLSDTRNSGTKTTSDFDPATGLFKINGSPAAIDIKNDVMLFNYDYAVNDGKIKSDMYIAIGNCTSAMLPTNNGSCWNGGLTRLGEFTVDGKTMHVFVFNNRVWGNVTFDSLDGEVTAKTAYQANQLSVYDSDGNEIAYFIKKGSQGLVPADGYQGNYTLDGGATTMFVDGRDTVEIDGVAGSYTVAADGAGYTLDVYLDDESEYIRVTLDKENKTYTFVRPEVTITFDAGSYATVPADEHANINVVYSLPSPASTTTHIFRGWFFDAGCTEAVPENWKPSEDDELYAKWEVKVVLTVYNLTHDATEPELVEYAEGETVVLETEEVETHIFAGWFTTATFDAGSEYTPAAITTATTIYGKWVEAPAYYKEYITYYHSSTTSTYGLREGGTIKFGGDGVTTAKAGNYPFGSNNNYPVTIHNYSENSDEIVIEYYQNDSSSWHYFAKGIIDKTTGIILFNYNGKTSLDAAGSAALDLTKFYILVPNKQVSAKASTWGSGKFRTITATFGGVTHNIFITYDETNSVSVVNFGVSFKDKAVDGADVLAENCYKAETLYVFDKESNLLFKGGYNGSTMVALDGKEGTYAVTQDGTETLGFTQLYLNGVKTVEIGDSKGTYVIDGAKIKLTFADGYYEITAIDVDAKTCSVAKPMTAVTYVSAQTAVPAASKNTNVAYALPEVENTATHVFRGWFSDEALTKAITGDFTPTGTEVSVYAKWDLILSITVVYGNGVANFSPEGTFASGDKLTLADVGLVNGKAVDFYYVGADKENKWTNGSAIVSDTADVTINVEWMEAHALYGDWTGFDVYPFGKNWSGPIGVTGAPSTVSGNKTLTIDALGKVTAQSGAAVSVNNIADYDSETGKVKFKANASSTSYRYGYVDEANGVMFYSYSNVSSEVLSAELIIMLRGTGYTMAKTDICYWSGLKAMLFTVTKEEDKTNVFFYDGKIYYDVTYTTTAGNSFAAGDAYKQNDLKVFDSNSRLIAEFVKGADGLQGLDGNQGDYTGTLAGIDGNVSLHFNGVGKVQVGDDLQVDYTANADKLTFAYNNRMYVVTVSESAFTQVEDGYQGEYTLPDGTNTITLDGKGGAGGNKTYVVNGKTITIYDGGVSTQYGLDLENNKLLGKSIYAGLIFEGTCKTEWDSSSPALKITFADEPQLKGEIYIGGAETLKFTAEISEGKIVFTITETQYSPDEVGKTYTFGISGNTFTYESRTVSRNTLSITEGSATKKS